jgi:hypothetical protein
MSFEIQKLKQITLYCFCILGTVIKLFYYQPYSIFDQNRKNEHNIMDLRHYVGKENGDKFNSCTRFIVCYSTKTFTYVIDPNKIKLKCIKIIISTIVTVTFYKGCPNMVLKFVRRHLRISEIKLTFF